MVLGIHNSTRGTRNRHDMIAERVNNCTLSALFSLLPLKLEKRGRVKASAWQKNFLNSEVKAGRTDFKEKIIERAKNRKGGDLGLGVEL